MSRPPRQCQWDGCSEVYPPYGFALPDGKGDFEHVRVCDAHRQAMAERSRRALAPWRKTPARDDAAVDGGRSDAGERRSLPPPLPDAGGQGRLL